LNAEDYLFAPVLLFAYNRPLNTQKVLDNLAANAEAEKSTLHIYCDGAKPGANSDTLYKINETRLIANSETRFKDVKVVEQSENKGLSKSVIEGVTQICNQYGSVIVLEDDIIISPYFLKYMNEALQKYKEIDEVGCISGYWYPTKKQLPETFFLKSQSCWGWATWLRAWQNFETDGTRLLKVLNENNINKQFDLDGSIQYTQMLKDQISGKIDSWAVRWDAVNFINNKLCLYPGKSLVQNIGFDGSGIHSGTDNYYYVNPSNQPVILNSVPLIECNDARNALIQFYKQLNKALFYQRLRKAVSLKAWVQKLNN